MLISVCKDNIRRFCPHILATPKIRLDCLSKTVTISCLSVPNGIAVPLERSSCEIICLHLTRKAKEAIGRGEGSKSGPDKAGRGQ